jgi:CheY-like chemotaxis protein
VNFKADCTIDESQNIDLVIEVADTGIGIEEDKIDFIFEDFAQEEMSTTRKFGGTGLGLSIVKKLIELHKGTIVCVSKKNQGTTVTCHIPYQSGDEKLVKTEAPFQLHIPEEIRNLNFLIVDDEEYNRLLFKTILDRWKVKHIEVANGMDALETLKTNHFDLLFMDARMPGIDGLKATQFIRNEMKISEKEMPVICISAAAVNEDWEKYRQAGMNTFLPKPFTEETLLSTILFVTGGNESGPIAERPAEERIDLPDSGKITLQNLYHIAGGDEQFVKQMLDSFIESTRKGLKEMQEAVQSGNIDSVAELAHKMSPPCRHLGASELSNMLKKIEESSRKKIDMKSIEIMSAEASLEFEAVSILIEEHIAKIS